MSFAISTARRCRSRGPKPQRETKGDTRPSLEERYRDGADYAAKVRKAADALAQEGYLLPEDVQRIADQAASMSWAGAGDRSRPADARTVSP